MNEATRAEARVDGRNWARTSDLRLVEAALSQLSYTPGAQKVSSGPEGSETYATGDLAAAGAPPGAGSLPFARIVSSKTSRLSYFGSQPTAAFSFSLETSQG